MTTSEQAREKALAALSVRARAENFFVRTYREAIELADAIDPERGRKPLKERDRLIVAALTRIYRGASDCYSYLTGETLTS